jgi:hypothetical protein
LINQSLFYFIIIIAYVTECIASFDDEINSRKFTFEGYACDNLAGLLFVNVVLKKSVSQNKDNNNYFILAKDGKIKEELLPAEIIK